MQNIDKHKQERELRHPIRLRIWEMYEQDQDRSLSPRDLRHDMSSDTATLPAISQVNYHLRRLQLVGLVPER